MIAVIILLAVLIIVSVFFMCMARIAARPRVSTLEKTKEYLIQMPIMAGEDITIANEHTIKSYDGYELFVGFVAGDPKNKHYVVLSHGYTSSRYGMYKYASLYRKMGYNCVIYDNRGHGANKRTYCTFGVREARDLMAVIEDTYQRYGADIKLGLHGESMGSGIQITALKYKPKIDFIVNGCGYADILSVIRWKCKKEFHLPGWLADIASWYSKLIYGYSYHEVRPIDNLAENEIPICFVHGDADDFIHKSHSERMYEATKGYKELHIFEGAGHAVSVDSDADRYLKMLQNFLSRVYPEDAPVLVNVKTGNA